MLKKFSLLLALLIGATTLFAQTPREDFRRDIRLSASNYVAYPGPLQKKLTPAPSGKKPFYISHYARHGSRYLVSQGDYDKTYATLMRADSLGKLTDLGKSVLQRITLIRQEAANRAGELTPLGAEQHRGIAKRMTERFPEVFSGNAYVDAKSTVVIRCILSMENELQELAKFNHDLKITHDASYADMWYMNNSDKRIFKFRDDSISKVRWRKISDEHATYEQLMPRLFNDENYWRNEVGARSLGNRLFKIASNLQSSELSKSISLYDLWTEDEIYENWYAKNMSWYAQYGFCPYTKSIQPYSQGNLLRKIIEEANTAIAKNQNGANLRFGHEVCVMPLVCLLELDNYGLETTNLDELVERGWLNYRIFPMASNVQIIFYRKNAADKDVLIKVLLNENEARLPLPADQAPYYKWSDFKTYYQNELNRLESQLAEQTAE